MKLNVKTQEEAIQLAITYGNMMQDSRHVYWLVKVGDDWELVEDRVWMQSKYLVINTVLRMEWNKFMNKLKTIKYKNGNNIK